MNNVQNAVNNLLNENTVAVSIEFTIFAHMLNGYKIWLNETK